MKGSQVRVFKSQNTNSHFGFFSHLTPDDALRKMGEGPACFADLTTPSADATANEEEEEGEEEEFGSEFRLPPTTAPPGRFGAPPEAPPAMIAAAAAAAAWEEDEEEDEGAPAEIAATAAA